MSNRAKSAGILAGFVFFTAYSENSGLQARTRAEPRAQPAAGIFDRAPWEGAERGQTRENGQTAQKNETNKTPKTDSKAERQHLVCQPYDKGPGLG